METVEGILALKDAVAVGHIVEAKFQGGEWTLGEVMNVSQSDGRLYFYIHYLSKDKKDDDWVCQSDVRKNFDLSSLRARLEPLSQDGTLPGPVWGGFFQLSQLSKQTTAGASAYGASASSAHHDPHEFSPKTVVGIDFGATRMRSWYRSPYPKEYWSMEGFLRVCDCCLSFGFPDLSSHKCPKEYVGHVIYSKDRLKIYEVDGMEATKYCERLFLLSKLFLEDKRTSGDENSQTSQVTPFLFYVLMETQLDGKQRFVGYFSKYKIQKRDSPILSCILVLPTEQRKGFGKLLISVAYELAKREGRHGSAERPLSGPGLAAFMSWWSWRLRTVVKSCYDGEVLTVCQLSDLSGMTSEDVVETLRHCGALKQWGSGCGDVKLRESGKRAKIKMTMDTLRALERKSPKGRVSPNELDPTLLSQQARLCAVVQTPVK